MFSYEPMRCPDDVECSRKNGNTTQKVSIRMTYEIPRRQTCEGDVSWNISWREPDCHAHLQYIGDHGIVRDRDGLRLAGRTTRETQERELRLRLTGTKPPLDVHGRLGAPSFDQLFDRGMRRRRAFKARINQGDTTQWNARAFGRSHGCGETGRVGYEHSCVGEFELVEKLLRRVGRVRRAT